MLISGAEIIIECLKEQGVDTVFGYPGGAVLFIYDALYKYRNEINHYLTSHEQGAAHAADGYARSTGTVGVCIATSGPGATNLVTGIATAYMDSVPMVAITGNVGKNLLGKDSFQEIDITGITMPITKHSFIIKDVEKIADAIRKAFYIAQSGRKGPVLIDITKDATAAMCEYVPQIPKKPEIVSDRLKERDIEEASRLINEAERPFIIAGGGVILSEAEKELRAFVEKIDAPVTLTSMGIGAFPSDNPYYTGMIGMHGTKASNTGAMECDLLIALGTRFSDRVVSDVNKFAPNAKILHFDIDPAEIDKNIVSYCSVVGDLKLSLSRILPRIEEKKHKEWTGHILHLKEAYPLKYENTEGLKPQYILETISELINKDDIVVTEVGQHQMWACQYIKREKPGTFLTSGGLGTMGYGLGASIGASIGNPERTVFNIAGDGCFRMNNIELATAVEYNSNVKVAIINNHSLGMVRQWQSLFYDKRYSHTTINRTTDFAELAKAYKCLAFHVTKKEQVEPILKEAISHKGPVVINFEISADEMVYPMVPPGAGIDQIVME